MQREAVLAWSLLVGAGLLEVVWAIALKQSEGFSRIVPSVVGIVAAVTSFVMLAFALRWLPVGTAYAVWVGIGAALTVGWAMATGVEPFSVLKVLFIAGLVGGAAGVALAGIVALGDSASAARLGCVALIVAGVVGLKLIE
jgi:quaternary ammonium compound-resistance protein SugE